MLLFKKKDLLVVISKSGDTVQFTKSLKDILKYQHRYNYKFKLYENGKVTTADDYIIGDETLTVLFGSATVTYTSEGASYTEGEGGGSGSSGYNIEGQYKANNKTDYTINANSTLFIELTDGITNLITYEDVNFNDLAGSKLVLSGYELSLLVSANSQYVNIKSIFLNANDTIGVTIENSKSEAVSINTGAIDITFCAIFNEVS